MIEYQQPNIPTGLVLSQSCGGLAKGLRCHSQATRHSTNLCLICVGNDYDHETSRRKWNYKLSLLFLSMKKMRALKPWLGTHSITLGQKTSTLVFIFWENAQGWISYLLFISLFVPWCKICLPNHLIELCWNFTVVGSESWRISILLKFWMSTACWLGMKDPWCDPSIPSIFFGLLFSPVSCLWEFWHSQSVTQRASRNLVIDKDCFFFKFAYFLFHISFLCLCVNRCANCEIWHLGVHKGGIEIHHCFPYFWQVCALHVYQLWQFCVSLTFTWTRSKKILFSLHPSTHSYPMCLVQLCLIYLSFMSMCAVQWMTCPLTLIL